MRTVLAAAAVLALAGPAGGQPPPSPPVAGQPAAAGGIDRARALIGERRFVEALAVLEPLAREQPVDADALFLIGLSGIEASQRSGISAGPRDSLLDAAIAALRTMLVRDPGLVRVRLELARAFFLKGEDTLAKRHFERVLAGDPPATVARNVNRFLAQMRARKRWSIEVGAALAPDSNIGASSDERIIYIFGLPFRRDQEDLTSSGVGVSVWAGGEYQHPLGERWRLRGGADVSRREYRNSEFDRMTVAGHVGPRWLVGRATESSVLASVRQRWLGTEIDHRDLGIRVEAHHRLSRRTSASLYASRHERRYDERTFLDGPVTDASVGVGWGATPAVRVNTAVGWGRERTELERWRHSRRWLRVGASAQLPYGFTVGGSGTLRWTNYRGNWFPNTPDGSPRRDLTRSLRLDVYNRAFTVGGFSPQLALVREKRTTNAQLYDYQRVFGELRFVRLF